MGKCRDHSREDFFMKNSLIGEGLRSMESPCRAAGATAIGRTIYFIAFALFVATTVASMPAIAQLRADVVEWESGESAWTIKKWTMYLNNDPNPTPYTCTGDPDDFDGTTYYPGSFGCTRELNQPSGPPPPPSIGGSGGSWAGTGPPRGGGPWAESGSAPRMHAPPSAVSPGSPAVAPGQRREMVSSRTQSELRDEASKLRDEASKLREDDSKWA
jgi:hypothetical protein